MGLKFFAVLDTSINALWEGGNISLPVSVFKNLGLVFGNPSSDL